MKLSEIYETEQETPELELAVTVYNINPGYKLLIDTGKSAEIPRIISDREYRERLYQENRLV